ncbi:MAG: methyl-accepting chemotaxis protein [Turicibacter sp.]|nr:methyl-accepting chemotaxis protein [Turicibacter sp.]
MRSLKLSTRLIVGIVVFIVVGLVAMYWVINTFVSQIVYDDMFSSLEHEVYTIGADVDIFLNNNHVLLRHLWNTFQVVGLDDAEDLLTAFILGHPMFVNAFIGFDDGRFIVDHTAGVIPEDFDPRTRPWYITAVEHGPTPITSDPYPFVTGIDFGATSALYVQNFFEQSAVFGLDFSLYEIFNIIDNANLQGGYMFLISEDGTIITHPHPEFRPTAYASRNVSEFSDYPNVIVDQTFRYGDLYFIFHPVQETDWLLVAVISVEHIDSVVNVYIIPIFLISSAVVILLAIFIYLSMSRSMLSALNDVNKQLDILDSAANAEELELVLRQHKPYADTSFGLKNISDKFHANSLEMSKLLTGISDMHREQLEGNYKHKLDLNSYTGPYIDVAKNINEVIEDFTSGRTEILECISKLMQGDFAAELRIFPGDEMYINSIIETLRETITDLATGITKMAKHLRNGNLNYTLDPNRYHGSWSDVVKQLNEVMSAVRNPLTEISKVLNKVQVGDFSEKVVGDFNGEFQAITNTLDKTCNTISSYINQINDCLGQLAQKNLLNGIDGEYVGRFATIKDSVNTIVFELNAVLSEISEASHRISDNAEHINSQSDQLARGADNQTQTLQQLSESINYVDEQSTKNTVRAKEATQLAQVSKATAETGLAEIQNLLDTMESVVDSSNKISSIIKTIDAIAFQTNLLALNASVEAARAGEHGKGFSVVAEEVRSLASRSATAANETTTLVQEAISRIADGRKKAIETSDNFAQIVENVTETSEVIEKIHNSLVKQSTDITNITDGLTQINEVVKNNSIASKDNVEIAESLNKQVSSLEEKIAKFTLKD